MFLPFSPVENLMGGCGFIPCGIGISVVCCKVSSTQHSTGPVRVVCSGIYCSLDVYSDAFMCSVGNDLI